ncbi:MAG: hypothetical protein ACM3VT_14155 [Solirubrobacterales bacterium]
MSHHREQHFSRVGSIGVGLIVSLMFFSVAVPDASALGSRNKRIANVQLDTTKDNSQKSGPWAYEYTISLKGSRSEGYHGRLSYNGVEVPEPANLNDFYNTPWGALYWVGQPAVLFGGHGWMSKPLPSDPKGEALMDPAKLAGLVFPVRVKVLASEELATPDRIEKDPKILAALKEFDVNEPHVQRDWFSVSSQDWVSLHDTKSWGCFEVRVAKSEPNRPLALEFRSTAGFDVTTSTHITTFAELLTPAQSPGSRFIKLPPQVGAARTIKCTLNPVVGDPLDLYMVCRVERPRRKS